MRLIIIILLLSKLLVIAGFRSFGTGISLIGTSYDYVSPNEIGKIPRIGESKNIVNLKTCSRYEIYYNNNIHNYDKNNYSYKMDDKTALKHLCEVSCGLKSPIQGENEILQQINKKIGLMDEFNFAHHIGLYVQKNIFKYKYSIVNNILKYINTPDKVLIYGDTTIGKKLKEIIPNSICVNDLKKNINFVPDVIILTKKINSEQDLSINNNQLLIDITTPHNDITCDKIIRLSDLKSYIPITEHKSALNYINDEIEKKLIHIH